MPAAHARPGLWPPPHGARFSSKGQAGHQPHLDGAAQPVAAGRVLCPLDEVPDAAPNRAHSERAANVVQDAVWARLALVLHHRLLLGRRRRCHPGGASAAALSMERRWTDDDETRSHGQTSLEAGGGAPRRRCGKAARCGGFLADTKWSTDLAKAAQLGRWWPPTTLWADGWRCAEPVEREGPRVKSRFSTQTGHTQGV